MLQDVAFITNKNGGFWSRRRNADQVQFHDNGFVTLIISLCRLRFN